MKHDFIPPTPKGRERLQSLLDVATDVFLAQGYDGASLDEIIARSGGSRATVYKVFGGKQQLFEAVVESICDGYHQRLNAIDYSGEGFEPGFRRLATSLVDLAIEDRQVAFYRLVMGNTARFPAVGAIWFSKGVGSISAVFQRFLRSYISQHEKDDASLKSLADALHGAVVFYLLNGAAISLTRPSDHEKSVAIETATRLATIAHQEIAP